MVLLIWVCSIALLRPIVSLNIKSASLFGAIEGVYSDMAIGVHTGGPPASAYIDALKDTVLRQLPNSLIMGDIADPDRGIEEVPPRYFCSRVSSFGQLDDRGGDFTSRGRCTQFRFLYILLTLRERFPDANWYIILDSDAWINVDGVHEMLEASDNGMPFLMGIPSESNNPDKYMVRGSVLILNRALSERFDPSTLMSCASYWYFANDVFEFGPKEPSMHMKCRRGHPLCWTNSEAKLVFDACNNALNASCGREPTTPEFQACISILQKDPNNAKCNFGYTRPEYPIPIYENLEKWDADHGDDHILSFCALTVGQGAIVAEPRLKWNPPKLIRSLSNTVCNTDGLSYHKLPPDLIVTLQRAKESCGSNN